MQFVADKFRFDDVAGLAETTLQRLHPVALKLCVNGVVLGAISTHSESISLLRTDE
ncbi:MAG: hypothetical protein ACI9MR_000508 [Myxococcota bacterium]|jgi:hypothetical protein